MQDGDVLGEQAVATRARVAGCRGVMSSSRASSGLRGGFAVGPSKKAVRHGLATHALQPSPNPNQDGRVEMSLPLGRTPPP